MPFPSRNEDGEEETYEDPPRWHLSTHKPDKGAPKLRGEIRTQRREDGAWVGRVLEEGMTYNDDRWFYLVFSGFGRPYSAKRSEQVDAAFVEIHREQKGAKVKLHARVRFVVARMRAIAKGGIAKGDIAASIGVLNYGPYIVEVSEATNKWEIVKLAVDKALPKFLKQPQLPDENALTPEQDTYEEDLDWVSENLFSEHMVRSLRGLDVL